MINQGQILNKQKAAMFGLDARIALAIFGALSVITGAALYSAIKQSKVVSYVAELNEISKAVEAYMLDTGMDIPDHGGVRDMVKTTALIEDSGVSGWKGPYIGFTDTDAATADRIELARSKPNTLIVTVFSNLTWGGLHTNAADFADWGCSSVVKCHYWIAEEVFSGEMAKAIDKYVDGSVSPNTGRLRTKDRGSDVFTIYYYVSPSLAYE